MELKELIKHRQSDRSYTGQEVEKERSSSAWKRQDWPFGKQFTTMEIYSGG